MNWQHKILSGLPRTRQERSNPTPTQLLFTFEILLLVLPQPSTREERSNATPTILSLQIFFFVSFSDLLVDRNGRLSPTGLLLPCACVSKICCCCAPASPRSAVPPRACISKVCCAGSCLSLFCFCFFFFCLPTCVTGLLVVVSQPHFFSVTERGPWGGTWSSFKDSISKGF
jgi:hypothetical protein